MDSMLTASQPFKSAPGSGVMERECRDNVKPAMLVASELRTGAILRGNYTMRCNHCREWNGEEEHRCRRCGRRLMAGGFDTSAGLHPYPVNMGAVAPSYAARDFARADTASFGGPVAVAQRRDRDSLNIPAPVRNRAVQTSLFSRGEGQRVVSIAGAMPAPTFRRETTKRTPSAQQANTNGSQQQLIFTPSEREQRRSDYTSVEAVIYCSDPVASIVHRMLAAAADLAMICIAIGLFAITFYLAGGEIVINRQSILIFTSIPILISIFYKCLWAIAGADSPGMQWSGLHTVNFDGKKPDAMQRILRLAGGCVGLAAVGIGFFWAVVDEETLTWHDHISSTFSTPVEKPTPHARAMKA